MPTDFKLPELGENIEAGDLVRLMIEPGASVSEGQPVMELETDKAVIEVPSSVSGTVKDIRVKPGEKVRVGQVIFTVEDGAGQPASPRHRPTEEHPDGVCRRRRRGSAQVQTAIRQEGKTEEKALPPDHPLPGHCA